MIINKNVPCVCGKKRDRNYDCFCSDCRRKYIKKYRAEKKEKEKKALAMLEAL